MATFNDKEFDAAIKKYGFCPFKSHELSIVPCSPKCGIYITESDEDEKLDWQGCSIKSIAIDINIIRYEYVHRDD